MVVRRVRRKRREEPIAQPEAPPRGAGSMTVQECRDILGESVTDKSDEQIARMLDNLEHLAAILYEDVTNTATWREKSGFRVRFSQKAWLAVPKDLEHP